MGPPGDCNIGPAKGDLKRHFAELLPPWKGCRKGPKCIYDQNSNWNEHKMRITIRARQEAHAREQDEQEIASSADAPMLPSPPTTEIPNEGTSGTRCVTNTIVRTRMHTLREFFCMQAGWSIDTCAEGRVLGRTREHGGRGNERRLSAVPQQRHHESSQPDVDVRAHKNK